MRPVGGRSLWWAAQPQDPFPSSSAQTPFCLILHPSLLPSSFLFLPQQGLRGQPRGPLPAGPASLTLGPSVPGVPGRPRGPWRPWDPGEPRSPGKPRSPCARDTKEQSGERWGRGPRRGRSREVGAEQDPGPMLRGQACRTAQGESRPMEATQKRVTGHSPWDPRGQELQLHQERPEEESRMSRRAEAFLSHSLGLPLGAELRLSPLSWAAVPSYSRGS